MLRESGLEATADEHGFILAAPDAGIPVGRGFVWNIPGVPTVAGTIPTKDDPDDVAYLTAALDWLEAQGCADDARGYEIGRASCRERVGLYGKIWVLAKSLQENKRTRDANA